MGKVQDSPTAPGPSYRCAGSLILANNSRSCGSKFPFTRLKTPLVLVHTPLRVAQKSPSRVQSHSFARDVLSVAYYEKPTEITRENDIKSVTIVHMEFSVLQG